MTSAASPGADAPRFSVVVPTRDRIDLLPRVLAAWERQQPAELSFELVVVDDGSTDGTTELLTAYRSRRFDLVVLRQQPAGPAAARNLALAALRAELVLFTGDDIEPAPNLLAEHLKAHRELAGGELAVLGLVRWPAAATLTATMRHIDGPGAEQFSYHYLRDGETYDFRHFYTSNISLPRRLLLREPSGFSTDFAYAAFEDAELSYRLSRHGMRIVYRAAAVADHHHRHDVRSFLERQRRCGAMALVLVRLHPELARLIGVDELSRLTWRERLSGLFRRRRRRRRRQLEPSVAQLEVALLELIRSYDLAATPNLSTVLSPLFRYGFLTGMIERTTSPEGAARLAAGLLLDTLAPALRHFVAELTRAGTPPPAAALAPVRALLDT